MKLMIIAGKVSGDMHAAKLMSAIKEKEPTASFFGVGGNNMQVQGAKISYHVKDMAVMGFTEVIKRFAFFRKVFHEMLALAEKEKPDAVILVDYPGFNMRFAKKIHELGIKVIYYICPQVWAWNKSRIPKMAKFIDELITIFPFEKEHFKKTNLSVHYVGHPLVEDAKKALSKPQFNHGFANEPVVALLPGSRSHEIERILPDMWYAALLTEKNHPDASFIIAAPSEEMAKLAEDKINSFSKKPERWKIITGNTRQVLRSARAAMVMSGTATIETALMLCPMVIAYRMSKLTYFLGKMLVKVDNIGMVNIIAGKQVCPEFIQDDVTPEALANAIDPLLTNTKERSDMFEALKKVSQSLGYGGAEEKAADVIIKKLKN